MQSFAWLLACAYGPASKVVLTLAGLAVGRASGTESFSDPAESGVYLLAGRPPFLGQAKLTIPYRQLLATSDGRVLASDLSGSTRFLLLSADGQLTSRVGAGVGAESSLPAEVAGRAYAQVLAVHPREPRVASGAVRGGALAIFDLGGLLVDSAAVPTVFEPRVEVGSAPDGRPVMRLGAETRFGYVGMAATCSFVVGLFSGRRLLDHSREASAGDQIHLFDWQGRLLETYALDRGIRGIVADEATGKVYATYWGTHPAIVVFQVPALVADTIRGRCT